MSDALDPARPAILSYASRNGRRELVGVAFAIPLGPGDAPPAEPFGVDVWHDHTGAVDEELLLLNHPSTMHGKGTGHRLAVVHVWTGVENPAGLLTQNNWALPFWRHGLDAPDPLSSIAARGASLASDGGAFYRDLVHRVADLTPPEAAAVDEALAGAAEAARHAIERYRADPSLPVDQIQFEAIWAALWEAIRDAVDPEKWIAISKLSGAEGR
ncbi:MAG: hypothetical protein ABFS34_15385 [Gemmatimonadota bacterium]